MKFDLKQNVGGKPLSLARDLLRREADFTVARASQLLGLSEAETENYITALIEAGYLEIEFAGRGASRPAQFGATQLGISLLKSRTTKRISRSVADQAVAALLIAIREVNANPELISSVEEADLFGSYAQGADDLGDVDVAVLLTRRLPGPEWVEASEERAAMTGGRMQFFERVSWGEVEVLRALRAASRRLDVQPKHLIVELGWPMTPLFRASKV